jgi:hypothetical protein
VGAWGEALAALEVIGKLSVYRHYWDKLGEAALRAGQLEIALRAFAGGSSIASRVGEAVVAQQLGREPARALDEAAAMIAKELERVEAKVARGAQSELDERVNAGELRIALMQRAAVEKLRGEDDAARATVGEVLRRLGGTWQELIQWHPVERLAGLAPP